MPAGGGEFEGEPATFLPDDVGQVRPGSLVSLRWPGWR